MKSAFNMTRTRSKDGGKGNNESRVGTLILQSGKSYRIWILDPMSAGIEEGFAVVERHFVEINGRVRPVPCNKPFGADCLCCDALKTGRLKTVSWAKHPMENVALPIYDLTQYQARKRVDGSDVLIPLDPHSPLQGDTDGGFKIWYATSSQFKKVRTEHETISNLCRACGGGGRIYGLACPVCDTLIYSEDAIQKMVQDEYEDLITSAHTCAVCGEDVAYVPKRKCSQCGSEDMKSIHDYSLIVSRSGEGKKTTYTVGLDLGYQLPNIEIPDSFWSYYKKLYTPVPVSLQAEILGIEPPASTVTKELGDHARRWTE